MLQTAFLDLSILVATRHEGVRIKGGSAECRTDLSDAVFAAENGSFPEYHTRIGKYLPLYP